MALTVTETKEVITGVLEKLKKSIERENSYMKELDDAGIRKLIKDWMKEEK